CAWISTFRLRPGATLVPYTTLFRSVDEKPHMRAQPLLFVDDAEADAAKAPVEIVEHLAEGRALGLDDVRAAGVGAQQRGQFDPEDRKSTRLNSSHDQISYAVFCLKK